MPKLDQYIRILAEESKVWKLIETNLIIITDFHTIQGKLLYELFSNIGYYTKLRLRP